MSYTLAELCMGYGGLGMGLELAGIDTDLIWCAENDPHASKVIAHHWPDVPNLGDLTRITDPLPVDIIAAGFPCTDISTAGKQAGIHGKHSGLWWDIAEIIGDLRPRWVVLENVAAILWNGGPQVIGAVTSMGYSIGWGTVRASDAGAPFDRSRWFAVATGPDVGRFERLKKSDLQPARGHSAQPGGDVDRPRMAGDRAGIHKRRFETERAELGLFETWSQIVGRNAPAIWDRARFREWMMGLPDGWVSGTPGAQQTLFDEPSKALTVSQAVAIIGNGVCPQQAALAISRLAPC